MSLVTVSQSTTSSTVNRVGVFQDLPLISRLVRLNVIELESSDKQIINELVYRWCRILTRDWKKPSPNCQVLIVDMIGSINPIRLATILRRESGRMQLINIIRQCKINSTYVTLSSYIKRDTFSNAPKLFVIYHDEFFIIKTLILLKDFLQGTKSQVLLVVPKLDRQERDVLSLISTNQILKCDFCVNRHEIGPAPPEATNDSYQTYLNQIYFRRYSMNRNLPDKIYGELREDGLHLHNSTLKQSLQLKVGTDQVDGAKPPTKRIKSEPSNSST